MCDENDSQQKGISRFEKCEHLKMNFGFVENAWNHCQIEKKKSYWKLFENVNEESGKKQCQPPMHLNH